ncbi:MAG: hypothetical protein H6797_02025 [Candidatus Nomurabacteria bacterium]|nr:MAG: hypothetical protein H6797_02025 [Candidatus Nomurabacteria bacterium]
MYPEPPIINEGEYKPWYRRRWARLSAVVFVGIAVVAVVMSIVMAITWNASAEKALLDATDYALKTPGTYHVQYGNLTNLTARVDGKKYAFDGTFDKTPVSIVIADGMLYAKSSDPQKLYETFVNPSKSSSAMSALLESILPNLKNHWISINLRTTSSSSNIGGINCPLDIRDALTVDSSRQQLIEVYAANPFLTVTRLNGSDYRVAIRSKKFSAFDKELVKSNVYQSLTSCPQENNLIKDNLLIGGSVVLKLSQDHKLQSMTATSKSVTAKVTADYGAVAKIITPSDSVDVGQIIGSVIQSLFSSHAIK